MYPEASASEARRGPIFGFSAHMDTGTPVGVQMELLYTSKGYSTSERVIKLDYLEVPLLATLKLPKIGSARPILASGIEGGMRIRTKYGTAKDSRQDDFKDDVNRFEVGWVASLTMDWTLARGGLFVEGRYNHGLTRVFVEGSTFAGEDNKHRLFGLYLGYRF